MGSFKLLHSRKLAIVLGQRRDEPMSRLGKTDDNITGISDLNPTLWHPCCDNTTKTLIITNRVPSDKLRSMFLDKGLDGTGQYSSNTASNVKHTVNAPLLAPTTGGSSCWPFLYTWNVGI